MLSPALKRRIAALDKAHGDAAADAELRRAIAVEPGFRDAYIEYVVTEKVGSIKQGIRSNRTGVQLKGPDEDDAIQIARKNIVENFDKWLTKVDYPLYYVAVLEGRNAASSLVAHLLKGRRRPKRKKGEAPEEPTVFPRPSAPEELEISESLERQTKRKEPYRKLRGTSHEVIYRHYLDRAEIPEKVKAIVRVHLLGPKDARFTQEEVARSLNTSESEVSSLLKTYWHPIRDRIKADIENLAEGDGDEALERAVAMKTAELGFLKGRFGWKTALGVVMGGALIWWLLKGSGEKQG